MHFNAIKIVRMPLIYFRFTVIVITTGGSFSMVYSRVDFILKILSLVLWDTLFIRMNNAIVFKFADNYCFIVHFIRLFEWKTTIKL